ncbi:MAG: twin-arginine translocase TatA/TatE family subunit [Planctomycetes bacterium]|nr:twin-arginine translocase TatA/TatE family subunit [Planctomycetota bacterium]
MPLLLLGPIGAPELLIILMLGLLMFGGRLPDVARSLGKSVNQFKKGLKDLDDDVDAADRRNSAPTPVTPRATLAPPALHAPLIDRSEPTGSAVGATGGAVANEVASTASAATSAATVPSADASSAPPASEPPRA